MHVAVLPGSAGILPATGRLEAGAPRQMSSGDETNSFDGTTLGHHAIDQLLEVLDAVLPRYHQPALVDELDDRPNLRVGHALGEEEVEMLDGAVRIDREHREHQ